MSFLSPLAFALAGLTLPLVLLYFLKVRRRERRVASLLLWSTAKRDREASAFFQRLQRDPLIILQVLALLMLATALARPTVTVMGHGARKVVVVLDTSASMKARDVGPSRFARAQAEAAGLVSRLGEGAEVMVIESGIQPKVAAALGRDRARALGAIASAHARDLPNRVAEAVRTARALVANDQSAEIYVFTDGVGPLGDERELKDPRIRWIGVGQGGRNVGITNLAVRKNYYGAFDYQAFVSLVNYTPETQDFTFSLDLDDKPIAEKSVTLEPNVRRSVVLPFSHTGGGTVAARLRINDDLAADNAAYAVLPPPKKIKVVLVSAGNLFLEKVLRTDPQVDVEVKTAGSVPGRHGRRRRRGAGLRPGASDRAGPVHLRQCRAGRRAHRGDGAAGAAVHHGLGPQPPGDAPRRSRQGHHRGCAAHPAPRGGTPPGGSGGRARSIYALEEQDRKAIFIGFDLFKTDFPLRVAFPLILSNSLRWLHPSGARSGESPVRRRAADSPSRAPRGRRGHRDHAERAERQGADHARRW